MSSTGQPLLRCLRAWLERLMSMVSCLCRRQPAHLRATWLTARTVDQPWISRVLLLVLRCSSARGTQLLCRAAVHDMLVPGCSGACGRRHPRRAASTLAVPLGTSEPALGHLLVILFHSAPQMREHGSLPLSEAPEGGACMHVHHMW
jgi:hypothetical protein